jgi:N-acetylmuramoyl-L-alanine amidase
MKIYIDPGHSHEDPGAVNGIWKETVVNLAVGLKLRDELIRRGHEVKMSRDSDGQNTSLPGIVSESNHWGADKFISLHCNSFNDAYPTGIETWYYTQYDWAKAVQDELVAFFPGHLDRGVRKGNLYVLKNTIAPAILVEMEFISNPTMAEWLYMPSTQSDLAMIIAAGVED